MKALRVVALTGVVLAGGAHATAAQPQLYTRIATQSCLHQLPNTVAGLPPAKPPVPPLLFVDALSRNDFTQLTAWYGDARGQYEGVMLTFFKSAAAARASEKSLGGGKLMGNVVATWLQKALPPPTVRNQILGCLRSGARSTPGQPAPAASLATFAGEWAGHTRGLSVSASGRGSEDTDDGCCTRVYRMSFQILSVSGTVTRAVATYRVTAFKRSEHDVKQRRVGDVGKLLLRNGIVTNSLTGVYFCSDPAWGTTAACGA